MSRRGRILHRSHFADYLEHVRSYHATEAYKKAMRKRQVCVGPLFAEAKAWHGIHRIWRRGLMDTNSQVLPVAAGQHWTRCVSATGPGRRDALCRSVVALALALQRLLAVSGRRSLRPGREPIQSFALTTVRTSSRDGARGG